MPAPRLYPHQWNWDSGFIAIGYSVYDQHRAQTELESLFEAQWSNGMLPHVAFSPAESGYFPGPDFWETDRCERAPRHIRTSGITQPPIHAIAATRIYERAPDKKSALDFLRRLYPRLIESHRYLYGERDPRGEGLVYIRHPWESGIDNSPIWDAPLQRVTVAALPQYVREDLKKDVPPEQRPTDEDYNKYVHLVELFKKHRYDEAAIFEDCSFIIQDALFNSVLAAANRDLLKIARTLDEETAEIDGWREKTESAIRKKLWHQGRGIFNDYDFNADRMIEVETASGFMPLFAGAPTQEQAERLYRYLESNSFCGMHQGKCFSVPNYDMHGLYFDEANYWRGPVWINMNWMLRHGLINYGFDEKAESVKTDIIELVTRYGFFEYFDPIRGRGLGARDFSWTAALFLDVCYEGGVIKAD